jgi:hypothetical protein
MLVLDEGTAVVRCATLTAMTIPVAADFLADLRRIVVAQLTSDGYSADATLGTEALLWNFLRVRHRSIEKRKRCVEWSSQLRARQVAMHEHIVSGLGSVVLAAEKGDDLNPYLSRELASDKAFRREDMMLNELGVHHFHLGAGLDSRGLVRGTNELLFAYVTDQAVHFIEVFDHTSFGDEEAFRIAQENWPHLFDAKRARLNPTSGLQSISPEERRALRSKNANVLVAATDGTLFFPPGGGLTPSGMSPTLVIAGDRILVRLREKQRWCIENAGLLADRVEAQSGTRPTELRLRFAGFEDSGAMMVIDDGNRARFRFE